MDDDGGGEGERKQDFEEEGHTLACCVEDLERDSFFIHHKLLSIPCSPSASDLLVLPSETHESSMVGL